MCHGRALDVSEESIICVRGEHYMCEGRALDVSEESIRCVSARAG